jgi:hypothetical protein
MSIAAVSNSSVAYQPGQQSDARKAFLQLINNIKSGDLTGAQQAFDALTQAQGASGASSDPNSPFAQALSQIGDALKSGNIDDAQKALASLQRQLRAGHHHQRHHGGGDGASANAAPANSGTPPTSTQTASVSLTINITA